MVWEGVAKEVLCWKEQVLASGGRVVLRGCVLFSLPIHLLAAALTAKGVFLELERVMAAFLWGKSELGL